MTLYGVTVTYVASVLQWYENVRMWCHTAAILHFLLTILIKSNKTQL